MMMTKYVLKSKYLAMTANEPTLNIQGLPLNFLEVVLNKAKFFLRKAVCSDKLNDEYKRNSDFLFTSPVHNQSDDSAQTCLSPTIHL